MITRIWHGATHASKSDEYLNLMRTVAIPDYRATPGNKGAYALRRIEGDTAHFLMVTFWESEAAIRAFAGDDISAARNTTTSTRISCSDWNRAPPITRCTTGNLSGRILGSSAQSQLHVNEFSLLHLAHQLDGIAACSSCLSTKTDT